MKFYRPSLSIALMAAIVSLLLFNVGIAGEPRHLFILSGQSNMTDSLKKGFSENVRKAFGDSNVAIAFAMRSGRGIRYWVKDYVAPEGKQMSARALAENGSEYAALLEAVKKSGDARTFDTVTFVWMQGESDAMGNLGATYERNFKLLLAQLKTDLGLTRMGFVIGRISGHGLHSDKPEGWKLMREIQVRLGESEPGGTWIDTDDLNGSNADKPAGDLHYPPEQSVILGKRFADKAIELIQKKS